MIGGACVVPSGDPSKRPSGGGGRRRPYVAAFEELHGRPVRAGHQLHHLVELGCAGPGCVNPRHVEELTAAEHGLRHRRERCARGHADWYTNPRGRRHCQTCLAEARRARGRS